MNGMKNLKCTRCDREMEFMMREQIQLGKTGWIIGDWGNLLAGALDVAVYTCPECGKLEFFRGECCEEKPRGFAGMGISLVECPKCGDKYDMDYPKCPRCGARNEKLVGKEKGHGLF